MSKSESKRIAETPFKRIDEDVLESLYGATPKQLRRVLEEARGQSPPNKAIISAVGGMAYAFMESADQEDGEARAYAKVVNESFPAAYVTAPDEVGI